MTMPQPLVKRTTLPFCLGLGLWRALHGDRVFNRSISSNRLEYGLVNCIGLGFGFRDFEKLRNQVVIQNQSRSHKISIDMAISYV